VIVIELLLDLIAAPGFPAKLLLVPALNLSVQLIDRAAQSRALRRFDPARIAPQVTGRRRNLATMAIWTVVFGGMLSLRGIGDRFPGQDIPFWQTACKEHPERACPKLALKTDFACYQDSGWGCNYLAYLATSRHGRRNKDEVLRSLSRACELGFQPGCENVERFMRGDWPLDAPPTVADLRILLSLYKTSRRTELDAMSPPEVDAEACRRGWKVACGR
jgi:hypothetical protein